MSEATEDDLHGHLAHLRAELEEALDRARREHAASMSMKGTLGSGTDLKGSVSAMESTIANHLSGVAPLVARWSGPNLSAERARAMIVSHVHSAIEDLATAETAYKVGSRRTPDGSVKLLEGMIVHAKARLVASLREFELGAEGAEDSTNSTVNIVHAHNIVGGVVQAGGNATQANTVHLSAEAIGASLDHLLSHLANAPPELLAQLEPEAVTIRAQLSKPAPNPTIVQESGRTIRSVLEGAVGGALGNAMSPGISQAITAFAAAVGLG